MSLPNRYLLKSQGRVTSRWNLTFQIDTKKNTCYLLTLEFLWSPILFPSPLFIPPRHNGNTALPIPLSCWSSVSIHWWDEDPTPYRTRLSTPPWNEASKEICPSKMGPLSRPKKENEDRIPTIRFFCCENVSFRIFFWYLLDVAPSQGAIVTTRIMKHFQ